MKKYLLNYKFIVLLFFVAAVAISIQSLLIKHKQYWENGTRYAQYNNYVIFKQSYYHLVENKDLYAEYRAEYWDLYKYSPTFALFFSVFAALPDALGLNLWNLLNAFTLLIGVWYLPFLTREQKILALSACFIELVISMQNNQSNALIAGLVILAFGALERKKMFAAAFLVIFTAFIKLYSIAALAVFLFYRRKELAVLYTLVCIVIMAALPLQAVDYNQLGFLYESWLKTLSGDHAASYGLSVMGWLQSWFGLAIDKFVVVLAGFIIFCVPLLHFSLYKSYRFRLLTLSSVLLCMVIFNHKAESPTFVIAMAGVGLWFCTSAKTAVNISLFIMALVFTSLSSTDLFPPQLRTELIYPYVVKVFPCILVWIKVIYDQLTLCYKVEEQPSVPVNTPPVSA